MTISVCMAIYNGKQYIYDQLESIRLQTREPEEVILCDDGSTDGTRELVRDYLREHRELTGWRLYCNEQNKGYPGNFYHAMGMCTKELVFPADQDDVWDRNKIARMSEVMERQEKIQVLGCLFGLIDAAGKHIHTLMTPTARRGTGDVRAVSIEQVFYKCEWPGMVLAYRNAWYQKQAAGAGVRTDGMYRIPHDLLLCVRAAEEGGFCQLEEKLAFHRRHGHNAGGEEHRIRRLLNKERKLKEIADYRRILESLVTGEVMVTERGRQALEQKRRSMTGRYEALRSGKVRRVIGNAWRNRGLVRWGTVVCDVMIVRG